MRRILTLTLPVAAALLFAISTPALAAGDLELRVLEGLATSARTQAIAIRAPRSPALPLTTRTPSQDMTIFGPFGNFEGARVR